jgi:hypothetical protein
MGDEQKQVTLANFNCTFNNGKNVFPMLDYLDKLILPAIENDNYTRKSKSSAGKITKYFLTNVKILKLEDEELVLVGEHVKRVILEVKQDYSPETGYIPKGQHIPSAPFSTFIIFLKNHRVAYFPDQPGSPDIRSFSSTISSIVKQYRSSLLLNAIIKLKKDDYFFNGQKVKLIGDFNKIFAKEFPVATLNVVPIPNHTIIDEKFKNICKIQTLNFKLYNLNTELDDDPMFEAIKLVMNNVESDVVNAEFPGPKNIDEVKRYANMCEGKYDFTIRSTGRNKEKIIVRPDSLSEQIPILMDSDISIEERVEKVYDKIKNRNEIKKVSKDHKINYEKNESKIISLYDVKIQKGK